MGAFAGPERNVSLQTTSGRSLYSLGVVQDGLVFNLDASKFYSYPKSGTAWTDLTNNGRNGTLLNGPTYNSSNGGSLVFDNSNDYVQCDGSITVTEATFIIWFKWSIISPYDGLLISIGATSTGILFTFSGNPGYIWNGASNTYLWENGIRPPENTWSMYALSVTSSAATAYVYDTGGLRTAVNTVSHTSTTLDDIKIGFTEGQSNGLFGGNMAQALIYNRALTAGEIAQNFNATRSRFGI